MTTYIALLRGINIGGNKKVAMTELCTLVAKLGFGKVQSLLQSGNLVFQGTDQPAAEIEQILEAEVAKRLRIQTDFFVRTAAETQQIIAKNPFPNEAERDPAHFIVMLFKQAPGAKRAAALQAAITGPEKIAVKGQLAYIVYPDGIGRSKLTTALTDRKLETRGTARNWNTVLKLGAMSDG